MKDPIANFSKGGLLSVGVSGNDPGAKASMMLPEHRQFVRCIF